MKRRMLAFIFFLALTASCTPTSTPTPDVQVVLATPTPQIPMATPIISDTPTATTTPTVTPTPTPTLLPSLPSLYIDGSYIKRSDTEVPVSLKGVQIVEFWPKGSQTFNHLYNTGLKKIVEEKWGINLLRIAIDVETVESLLPELEKLILYAEQNGMYCILTPFPSAVNPARGEEQLPIPDDLVAEVMGRLATKFKNKTNVLYGLWNEPHAEDVPSVNYDYNKAWQLWMDSGIKVAKAIRESNPNSILVVPGGRLWTRDLSYYQDHPFPFDNVLYDVHDYWAPPDYPYSRKMWTWMIGKYPLSVNEFGGACCPWSDPPLQSDHDIKYMQEVLQIVNQNPNLVHYTMWGLYNWDDGAIFKKSLELPRRGKLLAEDLNQYPATQFR